LFAHFVKGRLGLPPYMKVLHSVVSDHLLVSLSARSIGVIASSKEKSIFATPFARVPQAINEIDCMVYRKTSSSAEDFGNVWDGKIYYRVGWEIHHGGTTS
jgi:hypothetical protein